MFLALQRKYKVDGDDDIIYSSPIITYKRTNNQYAFLTSSYSPYTSAIHPCLELVIYR